VFPRTYNSRDICLTLAGSKVSANCAVICVPHMFILPIVIYFTCWCDDMEEEQYLDLLGYIKRQEYPVVLTKSEKYIMRRASQNYQVVGNQLHYIDLNEDVFTFKNLYFMEERSRPSFYGMPFTAGGHRGRAATIGKIKARCYWPNHYKDIEDKDSRCD